MTVQTRHNLCDITGTTFSPPNSSGFDFTRKEKLVCYILEIQNNFGVPGCTSDWGVMIENIIHVCVNLKNWVRIKWLFTVLRWKKNVNELRKSRKNYPFFWYFGMIILQCYLQRLRLKTTIHFYCNLYYYCNLLLQKTKFSSKSQRLWVPLYVNAKQFKKTVKKRIKYIVIQGEHYKSFSEKRKLKIK